MEASMGPSNAALSIAPAYAPSPLLSAKGIEKIYRSGDVPVAALRGVSLDLARGDFVAIMGASGSGKSSFMNIMGCLDRPTEGHYFIEGVDISGLKKDQLAQI